MTLIPMDNIGEEKKSFTKFATKEKKGYYFQ
jgi:hypothetical protein